MRYYATKSTRCGVCGVSGSLASRLLISLPCFDCRRRRRMKPIARATTNAPPTATPIARPSGVEREPPDCAVSDGAAYGAPVEQRELLQFPEQHCASFVHATSFFKQPHVPLGASVFALSPKMHTPEQQSSLDEQAAFEPAQQGSVSGHCIVAAGLVLATQKLSSTVGPSVAPAIHMTGRVIPVC